MGGDERWLTPPHPADWIGVYQELLREKKRLLEDLDQEVAEMSPDAARELDGVDRQALADAQRRQLRRLAFWRQGLESLQLDRLSRGQDLRTRSVAAAQRGS